MTRAKASLGTLILQSKPEIHGQQAQQRAATDAGGTAARATEAAGTAAPAAPTYVSFEK